MLQGIFATHLHALLDMDLRLPGVELRCMEVERRPRQRRPQGAVIEAEELVRRPRNECMKHALHLWPGAA